MVRKLEALFVVCSLRPRAFTSVGRDVSQKIARSRRLNQNTAERKGKYGRLINLFIRSLFYNTFSVIHTM
jgi:hypothetical protein